MKKQLMISAAVVTMLAAPAARAQNNAAPNDTLWSNPSGWANETFVYDPNPGHHPLFTANETTLDFFGTYLNPEHNFTSFPNRNIHRGTWGGGVGMNYFWSKDVGIGADTSFQDGESKFVNHVGGNLMVRFPIEPLRMAPYVFAGGGRNFDPIGSWFGDAGGGLEFRLNHNLGIFGDGRYIWNDRAIRADGTRDSLLLRAGIRVAF